MQARCLVCDKSDWENVDHLIHKKQGTHVCKSCGFVTYDSILKKDEMKEYYRKEYRQAPTINNEYSCERKLHYHNHFLKEVFQKWRDNCENPVVFESGAAYGRLLDMIKRGFPDSDVSGTELTLTMRRVAFHRFGIKLHEEFDDSKKYDLIISYKVAEHVPDVDLEIRKYAESLKDGGYLYIGVPIWFKSLVNFGTPGWDITQYYHGNHINMWTRKLFQEVLRKCGLKIVKSDFFMYDDAYLCKKDDTVLEEKPQYEDYKNIKSMMERIKKANEYYVENKFQHAFETWPDFPNAYINYYEMNRAELHKRGEDAMQELIDKMFENCPESVDMYLQAADINMRYERWDVAATLLDDALKLRPNSPVLIEKLAQCFLRLGKTEDAANIYKFGASVSQQFRPNAITWEMKCYSEMPMEGE